MKQFILVAIIVFYQYYIFHTISSWLLRTKSRALKELYIPLRINKEEVTH